ncbi:hypothetical protein ILUMI_04283 [Ignelater luminosus]|uniref:Lipase n=1 Tax=Ignelater luminosus TaxID=2038154 RepID=A0A8K0GJ63_IGNLU|nr:hypothetical protein ILUMI_04283 [Ignelater luminosus]
MKGNACVLLSAFAIITVVECKHPNNVCKTFPDYYTRLTNRHCWYNPDVTAEAPQLVLSHGYQLELYEVITEDFYILQVFRIPPKNKNNKGIVFLQHPSLGSCANWIDLGNVSLAFLLADAGYDVWMGNARGNKYSNKHVYLSPNSNEYWNHSFHEMGLYDFPAQFDLVRKQTGYKNKINLISHSMGATSAFVYASLRPQHASENIKLFICWTPVAYMKETSPIAKIVAPFTNLLMFIVERLNLMNLAPPNGLMHSILKLLCTKIPWTMELCVLARGTLGGYNPKSFLPERLPLIIYQNFAGMSAKAYAHYGQIISAGGRFQFYDYGNKLNRLYYHSVNPPLYPIKNIKIPMSFMYGQKDILADEKDVLNFYNKLPIEARYGVKKIDGYVHLDFQYGKDVEKIVFNCTINILDQFRSVNSTK